MFRKTLFLINDVKPGMQPADAPVDPWGKYIAVDAE